MSYTREVGERLRRIRLDKGLSLQDVERTSDGRWKAAVIGSYERGDRNISATRLLELAEFYGVSPAEVLPEDAVAHRSGNDFSAVFNLERLADLDDQWSALRRYCESIQLQRGDFNRRMLSLRGDDLRALAVLYELSVGELMDQLRALDVLVRED